MELDDAYALIAGAIDAGHAANGYLVAGDMFRCEQLVKKVLLKLFPRELAQIEGGCHPDVARLEPEGAKRIIRVDSMRERIVEPMYATAFSGGWKVGVVAGADRMEPPSANAFLKLLEEPPAKTMFLLTTDTPDAILPTIVSRTHRVDLRLSSGMLADAEAGEIAGLMAGDDLRGTFAKSRLAKALVEIYDDLKDRTEDEEGDVSAMRKAYCKTLAAEARRWMADGRLPRYQAFHDLRAIEDAYRQLTRSIPADAVLSNLCDRMFFPS